MPRGKSLNKGDESNRPKFVSNHTHYSITDGDARVSVKPGKPRQLNYQAQVSVDVAHHVITQIQADYADKKTANGIMDDNVKNLGQLSLVINGLAT